MENLTQTQLNSISDHHSEKTVVGSPFQISEATANLIKDLGGKEWYDRAKRLCCNFDVRAKEGFCSYLFAPYTKHTKPCSKCELGQGLLRYDERRKLALAEGKSKRKR